MAKYKIAWLSGDGIGVAAEVVLDKMWLDAEYLCGAIGWKFWFTEGDALAPRTVDLLKNVEAVLFGAVTNKTSGKKFLVVPLPKSRQVIIEAGGLIPYTRSRLLETTAASSANK